MVERLKVLPKMLLHTSLLFTLLVLSKAADFTVDTTICSLKASAKQLDSMTLRLYHGSYTQYTKVPIARATDLMSKINKSKRTVLFVPHYLESLDLGQMAAIINAYLSLGYYNVMDLHWTQMTDNLYTVAVCSTPDVGLYVGIALNKMVASGLDPTTLILVGHSLGGQAIGAIARSTNFTVGMLVGLDSAGPGFDLIPLVPSLSSNDAAFVMGIHTDRRVLGIDSLVGHVDFFPNGGVSPQPGCFPLALVDNTCSHIRAMSYWAEAITNPKAFPARKCDSWDHFDAGSCGSNEVLKMSPDTPTTARGSYFLHTGSWSPFGLGAVGADG